MIDHHGGEGEERGVAGVKGEPQDWRGEPTGFHRCGVAVELRDPPGVGRVVQVPEKDLAARPFRLPARRRPRAGHRGRRYPAAGGQPFPVGAEGQTEHPPTVFCELRQGFWLPAVPVADMPEADDVAVQVLPALVRRL